ncbi:hypothetical protein [Anderseniella sp. Alg231-50]|uniref:hypothetical protein n=1 Tax=Anderseniella sp. Alg231-50 TaxID=1922226 RepID=UPI000D55C167
MNDAPSEKPGPWSPGISSAIPERYLPLATIYRSENVFTSLQQARELADFTGLAPHSLVAFRPERLIVHEVLIRVMAELSVPDGKVYEDLGINFRRMVGIIVSKYVAPERTAIVAAFDGLCDRARQVFDAQIEAALSPASAIAKPAGQGGWLSRLIGRTQTGAAASDPAQNRESREDELATRWLAAATASDDPAEAAAYQSLAQTLAAIVGKRGRLVGDAELLTGLAMRDFSNGYGSKFIGDRLTALVHRAARAEGFKILPAQKKPVIMNVKGASAAGKSTLRPQQKHLAEVLGLDWTDFALISPDIFRKYLLDYASLDEAIRYAGSLTGHELEIVDLKLDDYMAAKAARGDMPHLLIDRFRFDSFSPQANEAQGGRLLTRFGDVVYMFFVITPPAETVERAWLRGQQVGRYKAVDDLLYHNIEAFSGMPGLFFTWALREGKQVHYEFLDNSVKKGDRPRTVAFGINGQINIFDIPAMLNVDRYKRVNVDAGSRDEVFLSQDDMSPERNTGFLKECFRRLDAVRLADQATGEVYAWIEQGAAVAVNHVALRHALRSADVREALAVVMPALIDDAEGLEQRCSELDSDDPHTLGAWGGRT